MPYQPFLIANFDTGMNLSLSPWLIPEKAFKEINNAFIDNGVIKKRPGISSIGKPGGDFPVRGLMYYNKQSGTDVLMCVVAGQLYYYDSGTATWNTAGAAFTTGNNLIFNSIYNDIMYFTDNTATNGIMTWNGTTRGSFAPVTNSSAHTVQRALMVFVYKERLVVLNTTENNIDYAQRARWSQAGSVTASTAWREDIAGRGNWNDAPTNDKIVSAAFLKDQLLVFFEHSTWLLSYTANPDIPFVWVKINDTQQCSSTFGTITYDSGVTFVSGKRLFVCDGISVIPYDTEIPDYVLTNMNLSKLDTCYGERVDKFNESWLSYPSQNQDYPNKILVLDYDKKAWMTNDFKDGNGNALQIRTMTEWYSSVDYTFTYLASIYGDFTTAGNNNVTWGMSSLQAGYPLTMGGGHNGYVYNISDESKGVDYLDSTHYDSFNFSILSKRFNPFVTSGQEVRLGYIDFLVEHNDNAEFSVDMYINNDFTIVDTLTVSCSSNYGELVWKRCYVDITAENVQFKCYLSDNQLADNTKNSQQIKIHAINLFMSPGGFLR